MSDKKGNSSKGKEGSVKGNVNLPPTSTKTPMPPVKPPKQDGDGRNKK